MIENESKCCSIPQEIERDQCIVEALDRVEKRNRGDRIFAYILLVVVTFAISIIAYDLTKLIKTLSEDMHSMSIEITYMRKEMQTITQEIKTMDDSLATIKSDVHKAVITHETISQDVKHLNKNIKNMQEDISDMNKLNPVRKFF